MSENAPTPFVVAAVQAAPVFLDAEATTAKACDLIAEAAGKGAKLIVFPEAFLPAYPFWIWFVPAGQTKLLRSLYSELLANAVRVPDNSTKRLCEAATEAGVHVAIGVNEVDVEGSGTTLFNTLLWIAPDGSILGRHRKLIPTAGERLVHGRGDGSTLDVFDTPIGRLGGLICWENYMPLARYATYAAGVEIYVAPTWDRGEPWLSTLRHIGKEGRCYVIGCCSAVHRDTVPERLGLDAFLPDKLEWINPGDSAIVDPDGKLLTKPLHEKEGILYAEVDLEALRGSRWQLDVTGHYARPDVFRLTVDRRRHAAVED